jgi:hypothetical protein
MEVPSMMWKAGLEAFWGRNEFFFFISLIA